MISVPKQSYIICSTPRTGSTLLCSLLKSTNIAGNPESYFRKQDLNKWALDWNLIKTKDEKFIFKDYVDATITSGTTENGVFATRIMWGTMSELIDELVKIYTKDSDINLLIEAFGSTKFIYLRRDDYVAQAVSLLKAGQTDIWHVSKGEDVEIPRESLQYDFEKIHKNVLEAKEHNEAWTGWFKNNDIKPFEIVYEDLSENPKQVLYDVLGYLGIEAPVDLEINVSNKKMSDDVSEEWIGRYNEYNDK